VALVSAMKILVTSDPSPGKRPVYSIISLIIFIGPDVYFAEE